MKIAIDLEGTLIAECGEFLTERTSYAAQRILPCGIRAKARTLLRELAQAGHRLSVYSLNKMPPWKLWLWCRLCGLPVRSVITIKQAKRAARERDRKRMKRFARDMKALGLAHFGKNSDALWPPCQGYDLILDDEPRHLQAAWRSGVKGILVTNRRADWTASIREATLQSPAIQTHTQKQTRAI